MIKATKLQYDVNVFFIDYLELIAGDSYTEKSYDFHSSLIRTLKLIARQLDIVIIIASCLKRKKNEFYNRQKPIISDLAFNIENYADSIFLLYRPEYYDICDFEDGHSTKGVIEVIVAKNKHGKHGNIRLMFKPEYGKILNFGDASFEVNPISINSRMNSMDSDFDFSRSPLDFEIGLNPSAKPDDGFSPF
jgi:replicative DNA helicase